MLWSIRWQKWWRHNFCLPGAQGLNSAITEAGKIAATGLPGLRVGQSSPGGWVSGFPVTEMTWPHWDSRTPLKVWSHSLAAESDCIAHCLSVFRQVPLGLPWSFRYDSALPLQGPWVRSLIGEISYHKPWGQKKKVALDSFRTSPREWQTLTYEKQEGLGPKISWLTTRRAQ